MLRLVLGDRLNPGTPCSGHRIRKPCTPSALHASFVMHQHKHLVLDPRLVMTFRQLDRMPTIRKMGMKARAKTVLRNLDTL